MKKGLLFLIIVTGAVAGYLLFSSGKKDAGVTNQHSISRSQHSDAFNAGINNTLVAYSALTDAFINWDTAAVAKTATLLTLKMDALTLDELKKDTVVYTTAISYLPELKTNLAAMTKEGDIVQKRKLLNTFSQNYYDLLRTIHYDRSKLYLQECPMAFNNETEAGIWLSKEEAIRNPYMGLHHPKYGKAMLECGNIKDSISFTTAAGQ